MVNVVLDIRDIREVREQRYPQNSFPTQDDPHGVVVSRVGELNGHVNVLKDRIFVFAVLIVFQKFPSFELEFLPIALGHGQGNV